MDMPVGNAPLITRCPDCATAFRAKEEQLAARGGRVRCGHCGSVFDAHANALEPEPTEFPAAGDDTGAAVDPEPPAGEIGFAPVAAAEIEPAQSLDFQSAPGGSASGTPTQDAAEAPAPLTVEAGQPAPEFALARRDKQAARLSPWISWPAALLLLLALLAQATYGFRGDLALLFPAAKPYAEELCAQLGCDLPLPRRAELMSIESSDLQADSTNPRVMVLSASLRNRAPFAQTPPALELTLTDTLDQPVARRILAPDDYLARSAARNPFPAGSEIGVKVFFEASSVKATGYRLYLFYP
jgi:predicted Zn finger-like uncharacterized protein